MKYRILVIPALSCLLVSCLAHSTPPQGCVVLPNATNAVQLRIYTNASPDSPYLFNTFDIEAYGETLLQSPNGDALKRTMAVSRTNNWFHNILIDGKGPVLAASNNMTIVEQASGPDWKYIGLDGNAAYQGELENYKRGILFVAPDLFVVLDHIEAKKPVNFQMVLHPPVAAQVDPHWHDLRLHLSKAGFHIHAPGTKKVLRSWEVRSDADQILEHTMTVQLGPTNKVARLDLLTIFAVYSGKEKQDYYAFKLVESDTAIGARIHRDGWPTMIAFKLDPAAPDASITGFAFKGPVGVDVFKPKRKIQ